MREKLLYKIYFTLILLSALGIVIVAQVIVGGNVKIFGHTIISSVAAQGGITPSTINTNVVDPNATGDPNLHVAWNLNVGISHTTTDVGFGDEVAQLITLATANGSALYGNGTNSKTTFNNLLQVSNFVGSGQKIQDARIINCYSMSDCAADSTVVTFAGGPVAGDEDQGMTTVSYLQQLGSLVKQTVVSVHTSSCNTTLTQNVTANNTPQTVTVASSTGCLVNDWVTFGKEPATASMNSISAQITGVSAGHITAAIVANYLSGATVIGSTDLELDDDIGIGQNRVLVNLSQPTYTTGTVASISGAGFTGSGTTWTNGMVGGDAINPGCINLTNDKYVHAPFATGAGALNSWYQIQQVFGTTSLGIFSTTVANDSSYHGNGVGSGGYTIAPCSSIQWVEPQKNHFILEANSFTWTIGDTVEEAMCPYPDVTGFQYHTAIYTAGGIRRAWYDVINEGPTVYDSGFSIRNNPPSGYTGPAWDIGISVAGANTGVVVGSPRTGDAFVALADVTASAASQKPCFSFRGGNAGGFSNPFGDGICEDTSLSPPEMYLNSTNTHVVTLRQTVFQLSSPAQNLNGTITTCNGGALGSMQVFSNSSVTTWGSTLAGGGSTTVLGFCNGTNWTVAAK